MSNFLTNVAQSIWDEFVGGIKQIDTDHYYIHEGKKFCYSQNQSINAAATYAISFTTPADTTEIHWRPPIVVSSGDKLKIELYETDAPTGGVDKSSSVFNYNRNSSTVTTLQMFKNGTTKTAGTAILTDYIGGGTNVGGNSSGGTTLQKEERVLKQNTTYTLLLTNGSAATNIVNVILSWYEELAY
ncbi:MAG: hypothetical protein ACFFDH_00485 [Promethearchaeota archaeon]